MRLTIRCMILSYTIFFIPPKKCISRPCCSGSTRLQDKNIWKRQNAFKFFLSKLLLCLGEIYMGCDPTYGFIPPNQYSSSNEMLVYFETSSTGHTYYGFQLEYTSSCKSSFPLLPSEYSRALSCQSKYFKFIKCSLLLEIGYFYKKDMFSTM